MPSNRTRVILKTIAATLFASGVAGMIGGVLVLKSGWYHVGSTDQHFQITHSVLEQGMRDSVAFHARDVVVPKGLDSEARVARGAVVYRDNCVQCHGGPGVAQQNFGRSMQPVPGPLVDATKRWSSAHLYWITKNGIKMSGMPAWEYHLIDEDLWSLVAFMRRLPTLSAPAYAGMMKIEAQPGAGAHPAPPAGARGNPLRGRTALTQYACNACHMIPGVTGSEVYVGRPLKDLAERKYIAGRLPNTQENLIKWIRHPQSVDPETAMPTMGVTEADALDISAYLLTRR
jgi:mono/diheme cytochrome c family protein